MAMNLYLELDDNFEKALIKLADKREMSPTTVIKQALRLYELMDAGYIEIIHTTPPGGCAGDE